MSQKAQQQLLNELTALQQHNQQRWKAYASAREQLWEGLAELYLWWRRASKIKGFLEGLYTANNIVGKQTASNIHHFTKALRLAWGLQWANREAAKVSQWSNALQKLHAEYEKNPAGYRTEAQAKLVAFISNSGGISGLIGVLPAQVQPEPKTQRTAKRIAQQQQQLTATHLDLGEQYFASPAAQKRAVAAIKTARPIPTTKLNYAVGLLRKHKDGYQILSVVDDKDLVDTAIVRTYKRGSGTAGSVLALLTEVLATQAVPAPMEAKREALTDWTKRKYPAFKKPDKLVPMKRLRRLLLRVDTQDILISTNRTPVVFKNNDKTGRLEDSCVVTVAKPKNWWLNYDEEDLFLRLNDTTHLERTVVQTGDLCVHTTSPASALDINPTDGSQWTAKTTLVSNTAGSKRELYWYRLSQQLEHNFPQPEFVSKLWGEATWDAAVESNWFEDLGALWAGQWVKEYGLLFGKTEHSVIGVTVKPKEILFQWEGLVSHWLRKQAVLVARSKSKHKTAKTHLFKSKDLMPVLWALAAAPIKGKVEVSVNDKALVIRYQTELADYSIAVPTCDAKGKRNTEAFDVYKGVE